MYLQQKNFLKQLSGALSMFVEQIILPAQSWTRFTTPLQFDGKYELQLCYLTLTPNKQQQLSASYGKQVIEAERSSVVNLPHLNKQEASVLTYFGLDRALTLHPSNGGKI